ncbi:MAG: undecaprenyl-diphosphate phosphatase, partial [Planctomycetota bacterium]
AIPAILGATVLEVKDLLQENIPAQQWVWLILGAVVAFVVGIVALKWLIRWTEKQQLHRFAYWCIPFGIFVIVWSLMG